MEKSLFYQSYFKKFILFQFCSFFSTYVAPVLFLTEKPVQFMAENKILVMLQEGVV